jgi:hypothetical protein
VTKLEEDDELFVANERGNFFPEVNEQIGEDLLSMK